MKWGRVDQDAAIFHENELVEDFEFSAGIQEQGRSRELKKIESVLHRVGKIFNPEWTGEGSAEIAT